MKLLARQENVPQLNYLLLNQSYGSLISAQQRDPQESWSGYWLRIPCSPFHLRRMPRLFVAWQIAEFDPNEYINQRNKHIEITSDLLAT